MTFYQKLNNICQENGTNVTKVATSLGFVASAGTTWKRMTGLPRNSTLKKIADHFGMTIDELLEGVDAPIDYSSVNTAAFDQRVWQTILAQNNFDEHKAIDVYLNFEKAQMRDSMNNSVIHDNHGVIGNANAPVNISNGDATLSAQETELISMFRKISVIKQAQLLVKAAELLDSESAKD